MKIAIAVALSLVLAVVAAVNYLPSPFAGTWSDGREEMTVDANGLFTNDHMLVANPSTPTMGNLQCRVSRGGSITGTVVGSVLNQTVTVRMSANTHMDSDGHWRGMWRGVIDGASLGRSEDVVYTMPFDFIKESAPQDRMSRRQVAADPAGDD